MTSCSCNFSKGNHTIAVIKGPEDYNTLKEGLTNMCQAVNKIMADKNWWRDLVKLQFYLGGASKVSGSIDYNGYNVIVISFLCMVRININYLFFHLMCQFLLGTKGAISNNSCIWCLIRKKDK